MSDLKDASYVLKNNNASGEDMISKEIIKCILGCNPQILLKLYNSALQYNPDILNWFVSVWPPIHKKGPRMSTDKYRGITLISSIFKLFAAILNNRQIQYCRDNHILRNEQLGFVLENRMLGTTVIKIKEYIRMLRGFQYGL